MICRASICYVTVSTHPEGLVSSGHQSLWIRQPPPSLLDSLMESSGQQKNANTCVLAHYSNSIYSPKVLEGCALLYLPLYNDLYFYVANIKILTCDLELVEAKYFDNL